MTEEQAKEKVSALMKELSCVASKDKCLGRLDKMEELHKRINALDRYLNYFFPQAK